jgi:Flp pilus assembly protein CpaB
MKSRTPMLLLVAIGCGLSAAFLANQLVRPAEEKVALVVAATEVPRGTVIKEAEHFFKLQEFPKEAAPPTALRSLDAVRNRVALRTLDPGQIASGRDIGEEDHFTRDLPKGHLALAVRVTVDSFVGGFVQPGARVDMICSLPHPTEPRLKLTKIFLHNVLVLAVNQEAIRTSEPPRPNANPAVVTLAVKPEQAEKIAWLKDAGPVTMALRRPDDPSASDTSGTVSPFDWPPVPSWQPPQPVSAPPPPPPSPQPVPTWAQVIYNGPQPPMITAHKQGAPVAKSSTGDDK